ncbi:protein of unknown function DUF81 [Thermodesulfatator indicus DSM 15286]|uniref:Probable membrane transporter protein n=1 Tax=Thermodesulfatator indicus (strain DSM 15286 / JCM 11887 / CIR29812) TaxID=667014 RepID=F8A941_THEID|nr:sulfite exporter TauE/SafE family protein [Thermodesulfatator indicus]AEH45169.1 protein of unknown function DUF81 [Thermodesulfatator indicus DSM 15286]
MGLYEIAVIFLAAFIYGVAGFAFALLAVPLLSFAWPLKHIVPLVALLATSLNGLMLFKLRKSFAFKRVMPLLLGGLPGVLVGAYFLRHYDNAFLRVILGLVLVLYGLWGLKNPKRPFIIGDNWGYLFGFLAGFLGGALNTPGPPVIIYLTLKDWGKDEIKSTLQGFFFLLAIFVIFSHWRMGLITPEILKNYLIAFPVILIGLFSGHRLYGRLSLKVYQKILYGLLVIMGLLSFPWKIGG